MRRRPSDRPDGSSPIHRVAAAGNAAFVVALAVLLAADRVFLPSAPPSPPPPAGPDDVRAGRVLLVVIDGLRADTAADGTLMPSLANLRATGQSGTVQLESLIPSTIAGVVALATGTTSPPADVLQDFRALPAPAGGVFEAVQAAGGKCAVAGPRVWADLYGRWVDRMVAPETLVEGDDGPLVEASINALRGDEFRLIVLHLGGPDDAAHVSGTESRRYAAAARAADAELARILAQARPTDLIVVTADHGNTAAGGHAGPERDVLEVPLTLAGAGTSPGPLALRRQSEIAPLVARALGARLPAPAVAASGGPLGAAAVLATLAACACGLWVCSDVARGDGTRLQPTLLNGAVWPALAMALAGWRAAALAVAVAALVASAAVAGRRAPSRAIVAAAAAGVALGALRLLDGAGPTWAAPPLRNAAWVSAAAASYLAGRGIARWLRNGGDRHAVPAGIGVALAVVLCGRLAGQTLSLSTLDVRAAYGLAGALPTLPLAVLVVMFVHAMPVVGVVAGLGPTLSRSPAAGPLAAAAGAVFVGELALLAPVLWSANDVRPAALALGGMLRVAAEVLYLYLSLAVVLLGSTMISRTQRLRPQAADRRP